MVMGKIGSCRSRAILKAPFLKGNNWPVSLRVPSGKKRIDVPLTIFSLAAFKVEKGTYPEKLSELSPAYIKKVPVDIFAEGPLVYKRDGKGYLLYSVGRNMKDDGGVEDEATNKDDIAVRVR